MVTVVGILCADIDQMSSGSSSEYTSIAQKWGGQIVKGQRRRLHGVFIAYSLKI